MSRIPADPGRAQVTILMATWQGARHLPDQLASLAAQTDRNWQLWVSDDGSTDDTCSIVADFARHHPVRLMKGPQKGAAQNFLALLNHPDLPAGPIAFADQDDVWLPGKLARARSCLAALPPDKPALYAAASRLVDEDLRPLPPSPFPRITPSFGNALVQNLFSGHTMVLNGPALALARQAGASPLIRYHDWWLYQLIAGAGGHLLLDPEIVALYRQHDTNTLGAGRGARAAMRRMLRLASGDWHATLQAHAFGLRQAGDLLTPGARHTLDAYLDRFPRRGLARAAAFRRHGLSRSTPAAGLILQICAGLGRV